MRKYIILTIVILTLIVCQRVVAFEQNPISDRVLKQATASKSRNVKLYACQIVEDRLKRDVNNLANLASAMVGNVNIYTAQIVKYYDKNITARGFLLPDFQEFVDITNKNEASNKESLNKIKGYIISISCADPNPKNNLKKFQEEMDIIINNLNQSKTRAKQVIREIKELEVSNSATSSATSK